MSPIPVVYCPEGISPPAWAGPGALPFIGQGPWGGPGGKIHGGAFSVGDWRQSRAGWWVLTTGALPQLLVRTPAHPRVRHWVCVEGSVEGHAWLIPQLLRPNGKTYESALDRTWAPEGWQDPADLSALSGRLLALAHDRDANGPSPDLSREIVQLVADLLAVGQRVDLPLLECCGWITESLMGAAILAAVGLPLDQSGLPVRQEVVRC